MNSKTLKNIGTRLVLLIVAAGFFIFVYVGLDTGEAPSRGENPKITTDPVGYWFMMSFYIGMCCFAFIPAMLPSKWLYFIFGDDNHK
ncbi:hypothetical protein N7931_11130 [Catenovulum sp. 2E275]|uniref:hypothetical protein n=1 Tax=Catenovulum sp. 2E275 TaxID=2980497 RepID=UPI0021CFE363|nr:hypothetical protein [Catenovulum sp. 2E275]MCU4676183.1 hypothetical protein [Catenovulum sp. 2E275]